MSLNAVHISVIIFGNTKEIAENKLHELVKDLEDGIIIRKRDYVKTKDKTYQVKRFNENCRGYRYREVYIDKEIIWNDPDALGTITVKLMPPSCYGLPQDDNYNRRDHIHFY